MINIPDDCGRKHRTEAIGIIVSRPYAPAGAKKEREGELFKIKTNVLQKDKRESSTIEALASI